LVFIARTSSPVTRHSLGITQCHFIRAPELQHRLQNSTILREFTRLIPHRHHHHALRASLPHILSLPIKERNQFNVQKTCTIRIGPLISFPIPPFIMSDLDDNASSGAEQEEHELNAGLAEDAAGPGDGGPEESADEGLYGDVGKGEELFFDEDMDTKDADFVRRMLQRNISGKMPPRPETLDPKVAETRSRSDAILSCPCCFSIVTIDCQRHSRSCSIARVRALPHTLSMQIPQPVACHVRAELRRRQAALPPGRRFLSLFLFSMPMTLC
jgi:hypothetical protein